MVCLCHYLGGNVWLIRVFKENKVSTKILDYLRGYKLWWWIRRGIFVREAQCVLFFAYFMRAFCACAGVFYFAACWRGHLDF